MNNPRPLEEVDPELSELIKEYCHIVSIFKKVNMRDLNRNDPCPCGSGKKFKKCHEWFFI